MKVEHSPAVLAKAEYATATQSFKDRGAAVLMTAARQLGAPLVIEDSSGNAGTTIAAYPPALVSRRRSTCPRATRRQAPPDQGPRSRGEHRPL